MMFLLDALYFIALLALLPWLLYKSLTTGKYRRGLWQKFTGQAYPRTGHTPCAWFHGVSVGEIHLLRPVIARFRHQRPGWQCVVSTTTDTGFEAASRRFPDLPVFFWPLDFSWSVRRALRHVRPSIVVLAEGEIWPNFLAAAKRTGVPVAVVNGRMSPRSTRHFRSVAALVRPWFNRIDLIAAQTEAHAASYRAIGAPAERVHVTGSVKFDGVEADRGNARTQELRRLLNIGNEELVWVAGSTQAPEEQIALEAYHRLKIDFPRLRLILVPRQRDRFEGVADLIYRAGQPLVRRSSLRRPVEDREAVVLVDTVGDLGALWGLADVAFVGGSLDGRRGGQNMIEPAAYGAAVVFGPHVWNFGDIAARLVEASAAVQIPDGQALERTVRRLLESPLERQQRGSAATDFVVGQQGATGRTVDLLDELLGAHATAARRRVA
jgi:3-deoxy-D-manno-octulosonic-acid transferase